jgi:hypothetical protein
MYKVYQRPFSQKKRFTNALCLGDAAKQKSMGDFSAIIGHIAKDRLHPYVSLSQTECLSYNLNALACTYPFSAHNSS